MADDFDLVGRVRIDTTELAGLSSSIGASFKGMAAAAAGALAAAGVVDLLHDSIEEARESVRVTALTEAAIKSTGGAAKVTADQIGDLATSISNYAGIDDEVIQGGENLLLTFKNVRNEVGKGNDIFNQATKLGVDMSVVFGGDVNSSMVQLGKALDNPIKGVTALQRVGVSFTQQQKDQIKTLVESGKTLDAQKIILGELSSQVGGAAAAAADPWQKFQVVIGNLKEAIGLQLLPIFNDVIGYLAVQIPKAVAVVQNVLDDLIGGFENPDAGIMFGGMEATLLHIGQTARKVFDVVKQVGEIVGDLISGNLAGAGVDIGTMLGFEEDSGFVDKLIRGMEAIRAGVQTAFDWILTNGPKVADFFMNSVLPVIKQVGSFIADNIVPILAGIGTALAASGIVSIIATVSSLITTLGPVILALISPIGLAIAAIALLAAGVVYAYQHFEGFRDVVDTVVAFVTEQFGNLVKFGQEIFPQLEEAVGHVFNAIQDIIHVVLEVIIALWHTFGDDIMTYLSGVFQILKSIVETAINVIANIIRLVLAVINGDWGKAWDAIKGIVSAVFEGIKGVISGALKVFEGIIGGWYEALKTVASKAFGALVDAVKGIDLFSSGANMIQGMIDGIKSMASKLIEAIKKNVTDALPSFVKDALGIHSPSTVFRDLFRYVPAGAALGIKDGAGSVASAMNDLLDVGALRFGTDAALSSRMNGAAGSGGINIEVNFNGPVANGDDVRGAIPELTDALRAAVGGL